MFQSIMKNDNCLQIIFDGAINARRVTGLLDKIIALRNEHGDVGIELDMDGVPYLDSAGMAFLTKIMKLFDTQPVKLKNLQSQPRILLLTTGFNKVFEMD